MNIWVVNVFDAVDDIEDDDLGGLFTEEGSNNGPPAGHWMGDERWFGD